MLGGEIYGKKNKTQEEKYNEAIRDIKEAQINPQLSKVKVSLYLDGDTLEKIKKLATKEGVKYQTWLNAHLKKTLIQSENDYEDILIKKIISRKDFIRKVAIEAKKLKSTLKTIASQESL